MNAVRGKKGVVPHAMSLVAVVGIVFSPSGFLGQCCCAIAARAALAATSQDAALAPNHASPPRGCCQHEHRSRSASAAVPKPPADTGNHPPSSPAEVPCDCQLACCQPQPSISSPQLKVPERKELGIALDTDSGVSVGIAYSASARGSCSWDRVRPGDFFDAPARCALRCRWLN